MTTTFRTHFTFRIDTWTPDGESIVEHVAGVEDYQVALAMFRAACQRWPGTPITLRQGARVMAPRWVSTQLRPRAVSHSADNVKGRRRSLRDIAPSWRPEGYVNKRGALYSA